GPLRDHGQHDVHNDDASHHHEYGHHAYRRGSDGASQAVPELHQGIGTEHSEIVFVLGVQVAIYAQEHVGLLLRLHQLFMVSRQGRVIHASAGPPDPEIRLDRDDHVAVL